ncbi:alpha/beta fold hydrolase [Actinomadura verrucosospora]|uniref:3-oxoadipate enol-lactone hydrolase n=1 Tax=Actinomadura verrucosospora TaxID=46165 RepID=A0A7D3ZUE9_ACTVE|nr:alpha/beta fold hydrolase [Actinomadura verrucosospora]QKG18744.1 3-oxoadipate enol-lactone hydrolase [Actinomadura verrucosospora]
MTTRLFAEVTGPDSGLPPVLLLHSLGLDHTMWRSCLPFLAADRRVIAADLPDHGGSPSAEDGGAELIRLLDDAGAADAHVVGVSLGGNEALALAARAPDRVRSVTAAGSFASLDEPERAAKLVATARRASTLGMSRFADAYVTETLAPRARRSDGPRLREVLAGTPLEAYTAAARRCFATDLRPLLPRIGCPVLLLVGRHDTRTPRSCAERIAAGLANPQIEEIPAAGHLANLDAPQIFAVSVRTFWSALERPAAPDGRAHHRSG